MPRTNTLLLDAHALARELAAQGIEQWWLAERLGVARRTVGRWLSGAVKRIGRENLEQLARLLELPQERLLAPEDAEVFATRADQAQAVQGIMSREAEALFYTGEQHGLYETMVKAVLHPGLDHRQRGILYGRLQIAATKQRKWEAARRYARLAIEHATAAQDEGHVVSALANLALLEAESGNLEAARAGLSEVRERVRLTANKQQYSNATSNLGEVLRLQGDLAEARAMFEEALVLQGKQNNGIWLAATLRKFAQLEDDAGRPVEARRFLAELLEVPANPLQPRMMSEARLNLAVLDAEAGEIDGALETMRRELNFLRQYDYYYVPPQLCSARILRAATQWDAARTAIHDGLAASTTRVYEQAMLLLELARVERACGVKAAALNLLRQARRRFRHCGMLARASWPL